MPVTDKRVETVARILKDHGNSPRGIRLVARTLGIDEATATRILHESTGAPAKTVTESGGDASGIGPSRHEQFIRESAEDLVDRVNRAEQDLFKGQPRGPRRGGVRPLRLIMSPIWSATMVPSVGSCRLPRSIRRSRLFPFLGGDPAPSDGPGSTSFYPGRPTPLQA